MHFLKKYMVDTKLFSVDLDRTAYTWKGEKYIQEYALNKKHTEALKEPKKFLKIFLKKTKQVVDLFIK